MVSRVQPHPGLFLKRGVPKVLFKNDCTHSREQRAGLGSQEQMLHSTGRGALPPTHTRVCHRVVLGDRRVAATRTLGLRFLRAP